MSKTILFVCKSCNAISQPDLEPTQGAYLFKQLQELNQDRFVIRAEECLWMCEQACVVAISAEKQSTYLFTDLPLQESAEALLEFAELYFNYQGKSIPFKKFPQPLQSVPIARIPSI